MCFENLCENCIKGPYICNTKNCKLDRVIKYQPEKTITTSTELMVVEMDGIEKRNKLESENIPSLLSKEEILSKNSY